MSSDKSHTLSIIRPYLNPDLDEYDLVIIREIIKRYSGTTGTHTQSSSNWGTRAERKALALEYKDRVANHGDGAAWLKMKGIPERCIWRWLKL